MIEHDLNEIDAIFDEVNALMSAAILRCVEKKICPACMLEALHDTIIGMKDQIPHIPEDADVKVEKIFIHEGGNA
jgi:hypothetical protein